MQSSLYWMLGHYWSYPLRKHDDWRQSRCYCLSGGCCRWCSQGWALFSANQKHLVFEMIWQDVLLASGIDGALLSVWCARLFWIQFLRTTASRRHGSCQPLKSASLNSLDLEVLQVKVHAMSAKEWDVVAERRAACDVCDAKKVRPVCGHWRKAGHRIDLSMGGSWCFPLWTGASWA